MARLIAWVRWCYASWATRSLAVGAVATLIDICVLLVGTSVLGLMTPVAAGLGVLVGSTVTFFLNKYFAFREHHPNLAPQALKFAIATGLAMLVHASLVGLLKDRVGIPVVLAKLAADLLVFSVGQLLLLRYVVFPKARSGAAGRPALPSDESSGGSARRDMHGSRAA
jgi:putative flippase GtrA